MRFNYHCEVGVVILRHIFLVFTQLDSDNTSKMWAWIIPRSSHEAMNESFFWSSNFVGGPEHLLSFQHLLSCEREISSLSWLRRYGSLYRLNCRLSKNLLLWLSLNECWPRLLHDNVMRLYDRSCGSYVLCHNSLSAYVDRVWNCCHPYLW